MSMARSELAPDGNLRVGINFGNALLAARDASGNPSGIAVDLARELAQRLNASLEVVGFQTANEMAESATTGRWAIAFLAVDPDRAEDIVFSRPYLEVDATYLVGADSPFRSVADLDQSGVRIAVSERSAYDLFLTRSLRRATLVRAPGIAASVDLFFGDTYEALAGLRPQLLELAQQKSGWRVLDDRFTAVGQAIGTPRSHQGAAVYLENFVRDVRVSGTLQKIIEQNGARGVTIAAP